MVSRHGIPLAAHLISTFYGDICSKICECLLRRGTLTLAQIIRFTEITKENALNCLRVLIHHNCVQSFAIQQEGAFGEAPRIITHYMALFDNIINKLRATKFMHIVLEELGEDCLDICQGLIQHGRLSFDQIIDRVNNKTGNSDVQAVRNSFRRLLTDHFIERCPAPEPFIAPLTEDIRAKKRNAKLGKIGQQQTIEQRAMAAAAPSDSMRFSMEIDDIPERKNEESTNSPKVGKKRKQDVLKSEDDVLDANRTKEVLWRVNFEEFVWRLLHKACVTYVETRINNEASIVLSAILDLSRQSEKSSSLSIKDIYDEVIKKDGGVHMDLEGVQTSLDQLGTLLTNTDESYSVDIKNIIQMAQNEEVESIIMKRYGKEAYRIFRLLSKAGRLVETDKIADSTFVPKIEAAQILYKLWKDEYLHMEKVTITGARVLTFNLWKVDQQRHKGIFLDEMYHALLNLRLRIVYEQDRGKEALLLPKGKRDGKQKDIVAVYRVVRATLERSLMNLDDAVVLFEHLSFMYVGNIECEHLSKEWCAYAVSSAGKRCVLEKHVRRSGAEEYACTASEIDAEKLKNWIESDECIKACGLDRSVLGISSDFLLEARFAKQLCSDACYHTCPNILDLYFNLAAGEGVYLPKFCEAKGANAHREMTELQSSGFPTVAAESLEYAEFLGAPSLAPY